MNKKILTGIIIIVVIIGAFLAVLKFTGQEAKAPKIDYFIAVSEPIAEQEAGLPILIKGRALVPDDIVGYRLLEDNGTILAEGLAVAKSQIGQAGNFKIYLSYSQPETDKGKLEIFARAADEPNNHLTSIPLAFPKVESKDISVFRRCSESRSWEISRATTRGSLSQKNMAKNYYV